MRQENRGNLNQQQSGSTKEMGVKILNVTKNEKCISFLYLFSVFLCTQTFRCKLLLITFILKKFLLCMYLFFLKIVLPLRATLQGYPLYSYRIVFIYPLLINYREKKRYKPIIMKSAL